MTGRKFSPATQRPRLARGGVVARLRRTSLGSPPGPGGERASESPIRPVRHANDGRMARQDRITVDGEILNEGPSWPDISSMPALSLRDRLLRWLPFAAVALVGQASAAWPPGPTSPCDFWVSSSLLVVLVGIVAYRRLDEPSTVGPCSHLRRLGDLLDDRRRGHIERARLVTPDTRRRSRPLRQTLGIGGLGGPDRRSPPLCLARHPPPGRGDRPVIDPLRRHRHDVLGRHPLAA